VDAMLGVVERRDLAEPLHVMLGSDVGAPAADGPQSAAEEMLTISPPPRRSIAGISAGMERNTPRRANARPESNASGAPSACGVGRVGRGWRPRCGLSSRFKGSSAVRHAPLTSTVMLAQLCGPPTGRAARAGGRKRPAGLRLRSRRLRGHQRSAGPAHFKHPARLSARQADVACGG